MVVKYERRAKDGVLTIGPVMSCSNTRNTPFPCSSQLTTDPDAVLQGGAIRVFDK